MYRYRVNEFSIDSNFPLVADAAMLEKGGDGIPLCVRRNSLADVPSLLRRLRRQIAYDVGTGLLLEPRLNLALLIDYRADQVTVDCSEENLSAASPWIWNAALGCRTLLRGGLPVHAAGVEIAGHYVGLMASSGSGKSTLTHFLIQSGLARFANDDLVPVYLENNVAMAFPSVSLYPKIGEDIAERNGLSLDNLIRSDSAIDRAEYYVLLQQEQRMTQPSPLSALFFLTPNDEVNDLTCQTVSDADSLILRDLHGHWLIGKFMDNTKIQQRARVLANNVPVYNLTYRRDFDVLPRLANVIQSVLTKAHS